ncbi:hypothetical protein [Chryseobacterium cucumeris]|uniref:SLOG domain-containing protein n=1 Tax=Chryseobacterium cucumeris TaxID=1813611 RepID=UPI003D99F5A4
MAAKKLKNIFLSASIPFKERHPKYYNTADIIAIRDSVIALSTVVLPHHRLIWGGHPSITPIINYVLQKLNLSVQDHVLLYQSEFFKSSFPPDNKQFNNVIETDKYDTMQESIDHMRHRMLSEHSFAAAVFIGGMEGIEDEFKLFREYHPKALLLPVASTGAGAKLVYESFLTEELYDGRLVTDYGYMNLFKELLIENI